MRQQHYQGHGQQAPPTSAAQYQQQLAQYQQQMIAYQAAQAAAGNHQAAQAATEQLRQVAAQAAAAGVQMPGVPPTPRSNLPKILLVQGFSDQLVNLNGTFHLSGRTNHERPVYEKNTGQGGPPGCVIYYWDERDGVDQSGWWMAPEVGGAHVWTLNNSKAQYPPVSGWRVPFRGAVDPNVRVTEAPQNYGQEQYHSDGYKSGYDRRNDGGRGYDMQKGHGQHAGYDRKGGDERHGKDYYGKYGGGKDGYAGHDYGKGGHEYGKGGAGGNWGGVQKRGWGQEEVERKRYQMEEDRKARLEEERRIEDKGEIESQCNEMQSTVDAQVLETDELFEKAKETYQFDNVDIGGKSLEAVEALAQQCFEFENNSRQLVEVAARTKRVIDTKCTDLNRRIQSAQVQRRPWLPVLTECKTALEAYSATMAGKQQRIQEMLTTCRAVQAMCKNVHQEEDDKRRKDEDEAQKAEADGIMTTALQKTIAVEESFKIAKACADKVGTNESWKLSSEELSTMLDECYGFIDAHTLMHEAYEFMDATFAKLQNTRIHSPFADVRNDLTRLKQRIRAKEATIRRYKGDLSEYDQLLYEKTSFLVKDTLTTKTKEKGDDAFFEAISSDGVLNWDNFSALFQDITHDAKYLRRVFNSRLYPGSPGIDLAAFKTFKQVLYRVCTTTGLTEERIPSASQRVVSMELGEAVEALEKPEYMEDTKLWRTKARVCGSGSEGYISVRGAVMQQNISTPIAFLEAFTPRYKVVKDTILTDGFSLSKFKTVRRLKNNDAIWVIGVPRKEDTVGVMRTEARMMNSEERGFITIRGNQGTDFIAPVMMHEENKTERSSVSLEDWAKATEDDVTSYIRDFMDNATEMQEVRTPDSCMSKEELIALREEFNKKSSKVSGLEALIKRTTDSVLLDLRRFTGPLQEVKERLTKMLNDFRDFRNGARQFIPIFNEKINGATNERKRLDDEEARRKVDEARMREMEERRISALQQVKRIEELVIEPLMEKAQALKAFDMRGCAADLAARIITHRALSIEVDALVTEGNKKLTELKESLAESALYVRAELATAFTQIAQATSQVAESEHEIENAEREKRLRAADEFALAAKNYLIANNLKCEDFFKKLAGDDEKMDADVFLKRVQAELGEKLNLPEELLAFVTADSTEIGLEECRAICELYYICLKKSDITASIDVDSKVVRQVKLGEIFEYMEGPEVFAPKNATRVRVASMNDMAAGWVSVTRDNIEYFTRKPPPF